MKQKLFTLLTLALFFCSGAWGQTAIFNLEVSSSSSDVNVSQGGGTHLLNTSSDLSALSGGTATLKNNKSGSSTDKMLGSDNSERHIRIKHNDHFVILSLNTALAKGDIISFTTDKSSNQICFTKTESRSTSIITTSKSYTIPAESPLIGTNTLYVWRNSGDTYIKTLTITRPVPSLTGAWKISDTDVTGETALVVQDAASPTVPTFSVGATSGTPTTENYTVAYSLKDGSTEGIFTYTSADGPTAISTSTAGSATIVATLTTKNASAYLTPATNTFEYTVTVSAATAPTISISGDASVARGGDLTLTADVTGVPTPSIEWFKCDDALKTNPVSQGAASTANTSLDIATTTVGTYYYYAVANNGVGGDVESSVKTITVVPQAPTLTAGGIFVTDSKDVTIAKADGEAVAATIKYSTDEGANWNDYSDALSIDATTTVQAKVIQGGLESAIASATYTKVVLDVQTNISGYTKWNWADLAGKYTANSGSDLKLADDGKGDSKGTEVLMSNIPKYGRYTINYPASFDAQSLLFKGEYPVRKAGDDYVAGAIYLKFTTTVPGIVTVVYADNGSNSRYVRITDTEGSYDGDASTGTSDYKTFSHSVAAGEVKLAGFKTDTENYIRFKTITFQPTVTVNVGGKGYATYCNSDYALDFTDKSIQPYVIACTDGTTLTLTNKKKIAKNEPVLLYSSTNSDSQTIPAIADGDATADVTNKLVKGTGAALTWAVGSEYYVLATATVDPGFYKANNNTVATDKAYLDLRGLPAAHSFTLDLDEGNTTAIANISSEKEVTNGAFYNLAGQKVAQPTKGLYIMNGKKVIIK